MSRMAIAVNLLGLVLFASAGQAQNPYLQPLKPTGFSLQAIGLPPRALGPTTLRAQGTLAVAVRVTAEDYIPRGLEPTLLIDGVAIQTASGITGVQGRVTTLVKATNIFNKDIQQHVFGDIIKGSVTVEVRFKM